MSMKKTVKPYPQQGVAITCRSFEEYVRMFDLEESVIATGPILDLAAGASSFTAEARRRGYQAQAVDPRYASSPEQLLENAAQEIEISTNKLEAMKDQYNWSYYGSLERHRAGRERSLHLFNDDYTRDRQSGSTIYIAGSLPHLPLPDNQYSLVLCSHFLFLYEEQFDVDFHLRAIAELLRVCMPGGNIRLYPLFTLRYERYDALDRIEAMLLERGAEFEYKTSHLPFMPGSHQVFSVTKR